MAAVLGKDVVGKLELSAYALDATWSYLELGLGRPLVGPRLT